MSMRKLEDKIRESLSLKDGDVLEIGKHKWKPKKSYSGQLWFLGLTKDTPTIPFHLFEILAELGTI